MSKLKLVFSPRALRDLDEIWDYSAQHWNEDRADLYVRAIVHACESAALNPNVARNRNDIRPNYRSMLSGSHIVFMKLSFQFMTVIRILHQRMDIESSL